MLTVPILISVHQIISNINGKIRNHSVTGFLNSENNTNLLQDKSKIELMAFGFGVPSENLGPFS